MKQLVLNYWSQRPLEPLPVTVDWSFNITNADPVLNQSKIFVLKSFTGSVFRETPAGARTAFAGWNCYLMGLDNKVWADPIANDSTSFGFSTFKNPMQIKIADQSGRCLEGLRLSGPLSTLDFEFECQEGGSGYAPATDFVVMSFSAIFCIEE
jgi:hypothetical protein